jgi:hypothetical protein
LAKRPSARFLTATAFAQALVRADAPTSESAESLLAASLPISESPTVERAPSPNASSVSKTTPTRRPLDRRLVAVMAMLGIVLVALLLNAAIYFATTTFQQINRRDEVAQRVIVVDVQTYTPTATSE